MSETTNSGDRSPPCASSSPADSRAELAALIESFLKSEITAFQFDDRLDIYRDSKDPVIQHVVGAVWYHYDDCEDHLVCLSKHQWDYFQRLLLVLASDCRIETDFKCHWSLKHLIAAISFCLFGILTLQVGWGFQLLALSIPFGCISIGLSFWRPATAPNPDPYAPLIFPFATFADLATAYHMSPFCKTRYPNHIANRRIRSPISQALLQVYSYAMWLVLSPFPLLFQSFPERLTESRVRAVQSKSPSEPRLAGFL